MISLADLRYAFRQLRHTPAFTVTVLVVLALGIGANAAMFSIIDATLLRWLPYHRPKELVSVTLVNDQGGASWAYYQDLIAWQSQSHTLQSMAYYVDVEGFLETKSATGASFRLQGECESIQRPWCSARARPFFSFRRTNPRQRPRRGT